MKVIVAKKNGDTCNWRSVFNQSLLAGPIEVGTVVDGCLCRRSTAKDGWPPCVEMTVYCFIKFKAFITQYWITHLSKCDLRIGSTIVWSPPSVMIRGWFFPSRVKGVKGLPPTESFPRAENVVRWRRVLWPSSICLIAYLLSYGVTGISPQSFGSSPDNDATHSARTSNVSIVNYLTDEIGKDSATGRYIETAFRSDVHVVECGFVNEVDTDTMYKANAAGGSYAAQGIGEVGFAICYFFIYKLCEIYSGPIPVILTLKVEPWWTCATPWVGSWGIVWDKIATERWLRLDRGSAIFRSRNWPRRWSICCRLVEALVDPSPIPGPKFPLPFTAIVLHLQLARQVWLFVDQ